MTEQVKHGGGPTRRWSVDGDRSGWGALGAALALLGALPAAGCKSGDKQEAAPPAHAADWRVVGASERGLATFGAEIAAPAEGSVFVVVELALLKPAQTTTSELALADAAKSRHPPVGIAPAEERFLLHLPGPNDSQTGSHQVETPGGVRVTLGQEGKSYGPGQALDLELDGPAEARFFLLYELPAGAAGLELGGMPVAPRPLVIPGLTARLVFTGGSALEVAKPVLQGWLCTDDPTVVEPGAPPQVLRPPWAARPRRRTRRSACRSDAGAPKRRSTARSMPWPRL